MEIDCPLAECGPESRNEKRATRREACNPLISYD
jgi:hypothetical protein